MDAILSTLAMSSGHYGHQDEASNVQRPQRKPNQHALLNKHLSLREANVRERPHSQLSIP